MNRHIAYAIGPELIWVLVFVITKLLVLRNQLPTLAGNQRLELIGWFLPMVGVVLSFVPLAWAQGSPWWWLVRIVLASAVGIVVVTAHLCGGIDYGDSRNSGVGTAFVLFIGLGFMALLLGAAIATFFFLTRWHFVPFLKGALILVAAVTVIWGVISWLASFERSGP